MNWYYWVGLATALVLAYYVGRRNLFPIPFVDNRVTVVITTDNAKMWLRRIEMLNAGGITPVMMTLGDSLLRAFYRDGFILNCVRPQTLANMGGPTAAIVVTERHPDHAAEHMKRVALADPGEWVSVWEPDPDLPRAHLCLVTPPYLGPLAIGCRRHAFKMGAPPASWNYARARDAVTIWTIWPRGDNNALSSE